MSDQPTNQPFNQPASPAPPQGAPVPSQGATAQRRLSTPTLGLVWFGASVSLAEILTGTFFAPLGLQRGILAIVIGHIIGGVLFWLVAHVSARTGEIGRAHV